MAPPKKMTVKDVVDYLDSEHDIEVTRQTVYNWIKNGRKGEKLSVVRVAGLTLTTKERLNDFLNRIT